MSTNSMTQNSTAPIAPPSPPSALDDGSKQLAWIIIGVMFLFAILTVLSYHEKPAASNPVKQMDSKWKAPKQVNAPAPVEKQLPVTNESEIEKPALKGTGELIQA